MKIILTIVVVVTGLSVAVAALFIAQAISKDQDCKRYGAALNVALADPDVRCRGPLDVPPSVPERSDRGLPEALSPHDKGQIRAERDLWVTAFGVERDHLYNEKIEQAITLLTPPLEPRISRDDLPRVDLGNAWFEAQEETRRNLTPRFPRKLWIPSPDMKATYPPG